MSKLKCRVNAHPILKQHLRNAGVWRWRINIEMDDFVRLLEEVNRQHPEENTDAQVARVLYRHVTLRRNTKSARRARRAVWFALGLVIVMLAFAVSKALAQNVNLDRIGGTKVDSSVGLPVNCLLGCAGVGGGGGAAQLQVRNALDLAWVNVGFNVANLHLPVDLQNSLPAGSNVIGAVTQSGTWNIGTLTSITNPVAVTGTFWQSTQPVSGTFWQSTQPVSGTFWQSTQPVSISSMPSTPVTGTFWQATQPISAVSLPPPQDANGNQVTILPAGKLPTGSLPTALVVAQAPNSLPVPPPVLTQAQSSNPLLYQAAMAQYCKRILCAGVK